MRNVNYLDLAPYRRSTVGFDRLLDLMNTAPDTSEAFPPFDIEKLDDSAYRVSLAVPGFKAEDIEIVAQQNLLTVSGRRAEEASDDRYVHRGIVSRSFERRFQIADFVVVETATFENGLLAISLRREVPEAMKPRKVKIAAAASEPALGQGSPVS